MDALNLMRLIGILPLFKHPNIGGTENTMNTGIVKWFNTVKGYGFITPDDGTPDAFVHITAVQDSGLRLIVEGQKLKYQMIESKNGKLAAGNLELVGEEQEAV